MSHEFQELEDGLLDVLAPLEETHGVRTLEAYAGQFLDLDDLVKMARRFPAVFVICDGLKSNHPTGWTRPGWNSG